MILRGTQLADRHEVPVLLVQFAKLIVRHGQQPCQKTNGWQSQASEL